jgi:Glycosyl hydrolase family 9
MTQTPAHRPGREAARGGFRGVVPPGQHCRLAARPAALLAAGGLAAALLSAVAAAPAQAQTLPDTPGYSLPLALQESLYFYDAQKSGPARSDGDQPLSWRGDSEPADSCVPLQPMASDVGTNMSAAFIAANKSVLDPGSTGCVNLSGGFHDAGDHVKFGLPQSYAAAVLGWGMYEFPQAYQATGTWAHAMDEMKWFSDYFLRSTFLNPAGQVVAFAYQVGEGGVDHDYWARPSCRARPPTRARPTSPPPRRPPPTRPRARRPRWPSRPSSPRAAMPATRPGACSTPRRCTRSPGPTRAPATPAASTRPAVMSAKRPGPPTGCTWPPGTSATSTTSSRPTPAAGTPATSATSSPAPARPGRTPG